MTRTRCLIPAVLFALVLGCDASPTDTSSPPSAVGSVSLSISAASASICANRAVPEGYVVTGTTMSPSCPGYSSYGAVKGLVNAVSIRTPTSPMLVCITWPIPTGYVEQRVPRGYVVAGTTMTPSCSGYSSYGAASGRANALNIQTPTQGTQICTSWPIPTGYIEQPVPPGYVVLRTMMTPACTGYTSYGAFSGETNALVIGTPTSPTQICVGWPVGIAYIQQPIPAGFVVVATTMTPACAGYTSYGAASGRTNAVTVRTPTSPMQICAQWTAHTRKVTQDVPIGFIATGGATSSSCSNYGLTRGQPNAIAIRRR